MAILINKNTKIIVQGITGHHGAFHTKIMRDYGTQIVAGVTPGKGGQNIHNVPVYNTVKQALKKQTKKNIATYSIIFVPAPNAKAAAIEALQNNLNIVLITEHVPVHDVITIKQEAKKRRRIMIGPNTPGIICPSSCKIGILPHQFFKKGNVGVISRSGTLTYEIVNHLTENNLGQSTVIGIGGDVVNGFSFIDGLKLFAKDKQTKAIVLVGEIGGTAEEDVAQYILKTNYIKRYKKPIVAYIAGIAAPKGKRMGHAGALIQGNKGTAASKIQALKDAGVKVVRLPKDIVKPLI
jgi:succinyl-CoA synthetase alpha subunit